MFGGSASDTLPWKLGDHDADVMKDLNLAPVPSGGDVLDLSDLLVNENANPSVLATYLQFSAQGSGTLITVDANSTAITGGTGQTIVLENIAYTSLQNYAGGTTDAAIITKLLAAGHLKTDI